MGVKGFEERGCSGGRLNNTARGKEFVVDFGRERLVDIVDVEEKRKSEESRHIDIHLTYHIENSFSNLLFNGIDLLVLEVPV
jgi:hypothetical protein